MITRMTIKMATASARAFIASVSDPDSVWTITSAERCLPRGWLLPEHMSEDEMFPLTVAHVAQAFRRNAKQSA